MSGHLTTNEHCYTWSNLILSEFSLSLSCCHTDTDIDTLKRIMVNSFLGNCWKKSHLVNSSLSIWSFERENTSDTFVHSPKYFEYKNNTWQKAISVIVNFWLCYYFQKKFSMNEWIKPTRITYNFRDSFEYFELFAARRQILLKFKSSEIRYSNNR